MLANRRAIRPSGLNSHIVAVSPIPLAGLIMPLVFEAHGHPILAESPQFLLEAVPVLLRPLPSKERADLFAAIEKLCAIPPFRVFRMGKDDAKRTGVMLMTSGRLPLGFHFREVDHGERRLVEVVGEDIDCDVGEDFGHLALTEARFSDSREVRLWPRWSGGAPRGQAHDLDVKDQGAGD